MTERFFFLLAIISKEKIYLRTKQGKILSDKLNGLKNFLLDFSTIKERKIKEVEKEMNEAAKAFDFEKAIQLRDLLFELRAERD